MRGTLDELRARGRAVGDAWLRVVVREPTRAGLADDVRALLPRAVDVRVEARRPRRARQCRDAARPAGAARRASCSPSTSRARASTIARVVRLFDQLYDDAIVEATG